MELLKFMMELDIYNYLILGFIIEFIRLIVISDKSNYKYSISHNFKSELIHIIIHVQKKY